MQTILKRVKEWFVAPVFPGDEDKTRNARVLYALLTNILILMVPATLDMIFVVVQKMGVSIILFTLLMLVLASRALIQRGSVRFASKLFVAGMWILFTLLYVFGGRTASAATNLLIAVIVTAGILLGKRSTIILAILSSLVGLGMAILENAGYPLLHFFPGPPIPSWVTWTLAIFLTLTPLNLTIQSIFQSAEALRQRTHDLSQRVNELNCLYGLSALVEESGESINSLMQGVVELLPPAWQYPSITCARITLDEQVFSTSNFQQTPWMQEHLIFIKDTQAGKVEVGYLEDRTKGDEEPFLFQEALLLEVIAERLGKIVERIRARHALGESEARFKSIYSQSPIAIELYDAEGLLTGANPACLSLFGITDVKAVKGFNLFEDPNVPEDAKQQLLAGKAVYYQAEFDFDLVKEMNLYETTKSGRRYIDCFISPWITGKGTPNGFLVHVRDMTEQVLAEEEHRTIIKTAMDGFWITDIQGRFLDVNDAYCQLIGYSRAELLRMNVSDIEAVEDAAETVQHIQNVIALYFDRFESRHRSKDGRIIDVEVSINFTPHDGGRFYAFLRDITERKQTEDILRESEERLEFVLEGSQLGYWDWDIGTGKVSRNKRWAEMLGYTLEEIELTVKQWTDLHHPDDRDLAWQSIQDHLEGRTSEHRVEYRMRTKDGQYKWILDQAKIVKRDPQGKPLRMSGTHIDITDRKQAENILQTRLRVNEFARNHSLEELLQNALDELCTLIDSPIGFFHFVEPDQSTLSLQAWSTRTIEEMCAAEGKGHEYDIDQAGVWVDCIRQGAPVIHNDYASLPHRKGLPEGHAPVIREMVFPITRNKKMVAIIGVGNKMEAYTEDDLAYASRLADVLWDITERKRAEEAERAQSDLAEALSDSAAALNSTLKFEDVLDRIMDNVGRVVPHDAVDVLLLDAERQNAQIVGHRDIRNQFAESKGLQFAVSQTGNLRKMQKTGAPVIITDTSAYDDWVETPFSAWIKANLGVPIEIKDEIIGFLSLASATPNAFTPRDAERLQAFVNHAAIAIENARLYEEVQKLAVTDTLTSIYNRAFFETELARIELGRDFPVSIVVADLDNLKATNDTLGHAKGDELLKHTAQIMQGVFRASDVIARIGGDEFAVLLPNTDLVTAEQMLSRVRAKIAEYNAAHFHPTVQLSLGAATAEQGKLIEIYRHADERMYADKARRKSSK